MEERREPPDYCLELLETFGCDIGRIRTLRQAAWVLSKLSGVALAWGQHDSFYALAMAWPEIAARLNQVPAGERFAWAREQPKVKADLTEFFPSEVQSKSKERTSRRREVSAAPNVVDLTAWRRQKLFREDDPMTAA